MATKNLDTIIKVLGIPKTKIQHHGPDIAKIDHRLAQKNKLGKLILVTSAVTPTLAGTGKTTSAIALADALNKKEKAIVAIRQPSLGPLFGTKGGASGGGKARLHPGERINLHFTGDFHAITTAHNLIVTLLEAHILSGNELDFDLRQPVMKEVQDLNNRGLRRIIRSPDGRFKQEYESGFEITAASEVMSILTLSENVEDMHERIGKIVVGYTSEGRPILASELGRLDAVTGCLLDAINPNLVQTLEGTPAIVHCGPFGNLSIGCSSVIGTKVGLAYADYCITEAGFSEELGAQKFFDILCRSGGLVPDAIVALVNIRDLRHQGGLDPHDGRYHPSVRAVEHGLPNLHAHLHNLDSYFSGKDPTVVAINRFPEDTDEEIKIVVESAEEQGFHCVVIEPYTKGGAGMRDLVKELHEVLAYDNSFRHSYNNEGESQLDVLERVEFHCKEHYGVHTVNWPSAVKKKLKFLVKELGDMEVCIAKTFKSITTDPNVRPRGSEGMAVTIRDVEPAPGAGYYVILCETVMRMPGLPRGHLPRAYKMKLHKDEKRFGGFRLDGVD